MSIKSKAKEIIDPSVKRLLPAYVAFDQNRNDRSGALYKAWGLIVSNNMAGAYYEFGVYQGLSFRESFRIYQNFVEWGKSQTRSPEMWRRQIKWDFDHHFYAFDTFEGMPDNKENNPIFAKGSFLGSLEEVKAAGKKAGMQEGAHIKYFPGLFSDVARSQAEEINQLQPAAIVNIDSDLYISALDALEIIRPKLQQGTVLLMDDWNCFNADRSKGERRALKEFLAKYPEIEVESWFPYSHIGQAFIVHVQP